MAEVADCRGDIYTGELLAVTDDVPQHIGMRSGEKGFREDDVKNNAELLLQRKKMQEFFQSCWVLFKHRFQLRQTKKSLC